MSRDLLKSQVLTKERSLGVEEPSNPLKKLRKMSGLLELREPKLNMVLEKALLDRANKKKEVRCLLLCTKFIACV